MIGNSVFNAWIRSDSKAALFSRAGRRHLNQTKSRKRRRSLGKRKTVSATDLYRITQNLPFTR